MYFRNPKPNYFLTSDQTRIFYTLNCNLNEFHSRSEVKPVLVFNYGLICSNNHWRHQLKYFDQQNYPVLIHDYRAHYNSSGRQNLESCTFNRMAQDLDELLSHLDIHSCVMIGHSMGVNVSLEFAHKFPSKVSKLVLISGSVIPPQDVMFNNFLLDHILPKLEEYSKNHAKFFGLFWKNAFMSPVVRKLTLKGGFNEKQVSDNIIQLYLKRIGELPYEVFFQLFKELNRHDIISRLEQIPHPTQVITGMDDKIIPISYQKVLAEFLPGAKLVKIRGGSHVPQFDFPDLINEYILQFL